METSTVKIVKCLKCNQEIQIINLKVIDGLGVGYKGIKYLCDDCVRIILVEYIKSQVMG